MFFELASCDRRRRRWSDLASLTWNLYVVIFYEPNGTPNIDFDILWPLNNPYNSQAGNTEVGNYRQDSPSFRDIHTEHSRSVLEVWTTQVIAKCIHPFDMTDRLLLLLLLPTATAASSFLPRRRLCRLSHSAHEEYTSFPAVDNDAIPIFPFKSRMTAEQRGRAQVALQDPHFVHAQG